MVISVAFLELDLSFGIVSYEVMRLFYRASISTPSLKIYVNSIFSIFKLERIDF